MAALKDRSRRRATSKSRALSPSPLDEPFRDFKGPKLELYLHKLFYFIRKNRAAFAVLLLLSLTIFFCVLAYIAWHEHREEQSLISFRKLMKEPTMDLKSGSSKIALEKLIEFGQRYGHRSARLRSMLYQLQYLEKEKKFGTLARLCLQIGDILETPELKANFYLRGALHAENLSYYKKAEQAYRLAAKALQDENELKAQALFGQSRMLTILGKKEKARQALKEILAFSKERDRLQKYLSYASLYLLQLDGKGAALKE